MVKQNLRILCLLMISGVVSVNAQIGYQVSLLNSATGEPRANETVGVTIEITNTEGAVVCNETKSATTNEFGVLSLQVGNSSTFANMDWSKLPLYISASVDGVMVGRSQILTVPVAEAAKTLVNVDPELICKTWTSTGNPNYTITLTISNTYRFTIDGVLYGHGNYLIQGNIIYLYGTRSRLSCGDDCSHPNGMYAPSCLVYNNGKLYGNFGVVGSLDFH